MCANILKPNFLEMLNHYETVFITTPVLSESQMKETVDKFKKFLKGDGAKIVHEENWGLRKLAYPIQKKSTGFYYLIQFQAEGIIIPKLETEFKRDERIIRFLTVGLDKYAVKWAEKKKARTAEKEKVKEE